MTQIKDIMSTNVVSIDADESVDKAAKLMKEKKVSCLVVTRNSKPIGIITERDIAWRVVADGRDPKATNVVFVTSSPVISVKPEMSVEDASDLLHMSNIKKLAVVQDEKLLGIITATDILSAQTKDLRLLGKYIENVAKGKGK